MNNFNFYSPTEFVFGKGRAAEAGHFVKKHGGTKVLIHFGGGSAVRSGLIDTVKNPSVRREFPAVSWEVLRQHRTTPVDQIARKLNKVELRFSSDCLNSTQACKQSSLRFTQRQGELTSSLMTLVIMTENWQADDVQRR